MRLLFVANPLICLGHKANSRINILFSYMTTKSMELIRNFSIIAHIVHGKPILADRIIQQCGGLEDVEMYTHVFASMEIERVRWITIKAQTAALTYKG